MVQQSSLRLKRAAQQNFLKVLWVDLGCFGQLLPFRDRTRRRVASGSSALDERIIGITQRKNVGKDKRGLPCCSTLFDPIQVV